MLLYLSWLAIVVMYSALLPVGQGHLPAMNDSQRKNQGGPAVSEAKPERGKPCGKRANEGKDRKADYSSKLKIAGTRMGFLTIPVHLPCLFPLVLPHTPLPTQPPPLYLSRAWLTSKLTPRSRRGEGERGERRHLASSSRVSC